MADIVKNVCDVLKENGAPVYYDARHDACKVRKGDITITSDGENLIIKNRRDTVFIMPISGTVASGHDIQRGERIIYITSKAGRLSIAVPYTDPKYVRVSVLLDVDGDGSIDSGAIRTFK